MNNTKKFISWRRVSTKKQGASGLGLEAQKTIIDFFVKSEGGELLKDFYEVYTGKDLGGCVELRKAMQACKELDAVLIIAKTDRFRNTEEALSIFREMDGQIYFCDLPHTDKFTLTLFFALAEREAQIISLRTKQALAEKKKAGVTLGQKKGFKPCAAQKASAQSRAQAARTSNLNIMLWNMCRPYTNELTKAPSTKDFENIVTTLNNMGVLSKRGKKWTRLHLVSTFANLKKLYAEEWQGA